MKRSSLQAGSLGAGAAVGAGVGAALGSVAFGIAFGIGIGAVIAGVYPRADLRSDPGAARRKKPPAA